MSVLSELGIAVSCRLCVASLSVVTMFACGRGYGGASPTANGSPNQAAGAPTGGQPNVFGGRMIQEADIYKLAGNTLYILNASNSGLQIVDVTVPGMPKLAARVGVTGSPRQIYVEGNTAYVLVSGSFDYDCHDYHGICGWEAQSGISTLALAVDVTDIAKPVVLGQQRIDGDLQDSRIVGNILYVVSLTDTVTSVGSFDVSNPRSFRGVDHLEFPFDQWDVGVFANVTDTRIVLAGAGDTCDLTGNSTNCSESASVTQFTPIDITDPEGKLVRGAQFTANGIVMDRWAMDFDPGTGLFRAVLSTDSPHVSTGGGALSVWAAPTIGAATPLGSLPFTVGDHITATAFDGPRVYVSSTTGTADCPDPVTLLDTTNPSHPVKLGSVAVPGAIDFLYPHGKQLIGLGHAEASCTAFQGSGQLGVSLFDVSDGAQPALLSQVTFGGHTATVAASRSDLKKAFLVLAQLGLILVPFQNVGDMSDSGGTQLIDLGSSALTLRGMASHTGLVLRAFPVQQDVMAFSDTNLQVLDITNRDQPATIAQLALSSPSGP